MFITLEKHSGVSEVMVRMFITLDGPPRVGEGIVVLINYKTPTGVVHEISCPMGIPPKTSNVFIVFIILAHGDHW